MPSYSLTNDSLYPRSRSSGSTLVSSSIDTFWSSVESGWGPARNLQLSPTHCVMFARWSLVSMQGQQEAQARKRRRVNWRAQGTGTGSKRRIGRNKDRSTTDPDSKGATRREGRKRRKDRERRVRPWHVCGQRRGSPPPSEKKQRERGWGGMAAQKGGPVRVCGCLSQWQHAASKCSQGTSLLYSTFNRTTTSKTSGNSLFKHNWAQSLSYCYTNDNSGARSV